MIAVFVPVVLAAVGITSAVVAQNADVAPASGAPAAQAVAASADCRDEQDLTYPGGRLLPLAGTELSLPNGIDVSKDQRYMFVAAMGTHEVVRFDRRATPAAKRAVSLHVSPDNVNLGHRWQAADGGPQLRSNDGNAGSELGNARWRRHLGQQQR